MTKLGIDEAKRNELLRVLSALLLLGNVTFKASSPPSNQKIFDKKAASPHPSAGRRQVSPHSATSLTQTMLPSLTHAPLHPPPLSGRRQLSPTQRPL